MAKKRVNPLIEKAQKAPKRGPYKSASWYRHLEYHYPEQWANIIEVILKWHSGHYREAYSCPEDLWTKLLQPEIDPLLAKLGVTSIQENTFATMIPALVRKYK